MLQLAGVVAVEVTGGPAIDFVAGRKVFILLCHDTILGLILFCSQGNDVSVNQQNGFRKLSKLLVAYEGFSVFKYCLCCIVFHFAGFTCITTRRKIAKCHKRYATLSFSREISNPFAINAMCKAPSICTCFCNQIFPLSIVYGQ